MILGLITHPSVWTKFHGNPSFLLCFFSSLDHFFFFFLFLFSLVIWEGNVLKDMVSLHLGFSPFFQASTRLVLHIIHGEVLQAIVLQPSLTTELLNLRFTLQVLSFILVNCIRFSCFVLPHAASIFCITAACYNIYFIVYSCCVLFYTWSVLNKCNLEWRHNIRVLFGASLLESFGLKN